MDKMQVTPGYDDLEKVIREFYTRAFRDPLIGHFFFHKDHETLIRQQTTFTLNMLGLEGPAYQGKNLKTAHSELPLTNVHFNRRRVLLREVLDGSALSEDIKNTWLEKEERLRPLIVNSLTNCKK